jgi:hypothetical protein
VNKNNWNVKDIQNVLDWSLIKRQNGWIQQNFEPLQLIGKKFSRMDGFSIDFSTGSIKLIMKEVQYPTSK